MTIDIDKLEATYRSDRALVTGVKDKDTGALLEVCDTVLALIARCRLAEQERDAARTAYRVWQEVRDLDRREYAERAAHIIEAAEAKQDEQARYIRDLEERT